MCYSKSFAPATPMDVAEGIIVLQKDYLALPKDSKCGIPGFFQPQVNDKSLESPSYNLVTKATTFAGHGIVRCIVTPASDITIVPTNLQDYEDDRADEVQIEKTKYILKSSQENSAYVMSGYRANVKLGLVVRSARDLAQRFQIDGAILLDPRLQLQIPYSSKPVCLLGMDFITKYPYLFYVPRFDPSGMVDFMIARDPFASRAYSVYEQFYKTVIVHVDGHHDEATENIGCGIFFKPGSVFNMFSGVSKYDKDGTKHAEKLKERGILMAIIKALHIVRAFPVGRDFRGIIIRITNPTIARLMAVTQVTMRNVFTDSKKSNEGKFDGYYYPTANRDLMLYFCHTFLRTELGFKITFEESENLGGAVAASLLAVAGAQMQEFCIEKQEKNLANTLSPEAQVRETNKAWSQDITPLAKDVAFEKTLYVSLGTDGYFHIQQEKAHTRMEAADTAGFGTGGSELRKSAVAISNGRSLCGPNALADAGGNPEKNLEKVAEFHNERQYSEGPISTDFVDHMENDDTTPATLDRSLSPESKHWKQLGSSHGIQEGPVAIKSGKVKGTHPNLRRMEERIYADAKATISRVKAEGSLKYELLEGQMVTQITRIKEEDQEKREKILKETESRIAATTLEYFQKRNLTVGKTKALIKEINSTASRQVKMARLRFGVGTEGEQKADMFNMEGFDRSQSAPLKYISFCEPFSEPSE